MSETAHSREPVAGTETAQAVAAQAGQDLLVEDDLLVEEVSIDGMCGVY
ncbi:mycofactocin precursor MftA [Streptomyces mirabilis]